MGLRLAEDAQKLVGEGGEDFLKSCWRRGAVSQSQKEAWGPGLWDLLTLGKGGRGSREALEGQGVSGANGVGPSMGAPNSNLVSSS